MSAWRDGVAREIPTELSGQMLGRLEDAWQVFLDEHGGEQAEGEALDELDDRIEAFELVRWPTPAHLLDAWITRDEPPVTICVLVRGYDAWSHSLGGVSQRERRHEDRFAALFDLPRSIGTSATIRPETLADKVSELFSRREVDFDASPEFSRAYYVLATDAARLRAAMDQRVLDWLATRRDLIAELRDRQALVLWPESPSPRTVREAVEFYSELGRRIGPSRGGPYR